MSENYAALSRPPETALRAIQAGDLKGKTDINPQWRYEIMDEVFGACGDKWKYEIVKLWDYPTADGTVLCFAQINVYTKNGDSWSDPIPGVGGNTLVDMVKGYNQGDPKRAKPNDEGFKMAITDALSTALKLIGVAADIYRGNWDGTKYRDDVKIKPSPSLVSAKGSVIDYLNLDPCPFNDEWKAYAEARIAANDVDGLNKCIEVAKKVIKKREENQ